ncbi:hypothetical protein CIY_25140 [Butyrivibrio fibrisolvens 16/4]|nr:hypothetical protein CIY_25140 [Butyrivibrio fibrisolvens 16/4]
MEKKLIDRRFYDALIKFEESEEAQDYYYQLMDEKTGKVAKDGHEESLREKILRVYAVLFCEDTKLQNAPYADVDDVADTADRLYIGSVGYDSEHWYRMKHHFPVIDDDNYDRFAALVIADLNCGMLHESALNEGKTLIVGEPSPLNMTREQRLNQKTSSVSLGGGEL